MSDHEGLPVQGYKAQPDVSVQLVNRNKKLEELLLKVVELHLSSQNPYCDPRWVNIAKTHFEQGFMALNRAVFRPDRAKLVVGDKFIVNSLEVEVKALSEDTDAKA